ncbi:MAG: hypothetical protein HYY93_06555 [Planctomycetes bacterium]|nr:hypothetical protein [Planctomycetota bacterium]
MNSHAGGPPITIVYRRRFGHSLALKFATAFLGFGAMSWFGIAFIVWDTGSAGDLSLANAVFLVLAVPFLVVWTYLFTRSRCTLDLYPDHGVTSLGDRWGSGQKRFLVPRGVGLRRDPVFVGEVKTECWAVCVEPGPPSVVARKENAEMEMRAIAERAAKYYRVPLRLPLDEGEGTVVISPDDLDLPFKSRALKYPQILGDPGRGLTGVSVVHDVHGATLGWRALSSRLALLICVTTLGAPFTHRRGVQLFLRDPGQVSAMLVALVGAELFVAAFLRWSLRVSSREVRLTTSWLLPFRTRSVAVEDIEDIRCEGATVRIISDRAILRATFHDPCAEEIADSVARYLRRRLMTLDDSGAEQVRPPSESPRAGDFPESPPSSP